MKMAHTMKGILEKMLLMGKEFIVLLVEINMKEIL
jgi:hypothetical protein